MTKKQKITFIASISILSLLAVFFLITYINWQQNYKGKLPPKTRIGIIDLSGKSWDETHSTLNNLASSLKSAGITFTSGEKSAVIPLEPSSLSADIPEPDLKYTDALIFDSESTLAALYGEKSNYFTYLTSILSFNKVMDSQTAIFNYNPSILEEWLTKTFPELYVKPESAFFSLNNSDQLINNKERIGKEINLEEAINELNQTISIFESKPIVLKTRSKYPELTQADLEPLRAQAEKIVNSEGFNLTFTEKVNNKEEKLNWRIKNTEIITWISAAKAGDQALSFDEEKIKTYLSEKVSADINIPATLPRFEINNGKVSSWQKGVNGRELDLEQTAKAVRLALSEFNKEVSLTVKEVIAEDLSAEKDIKIEELIGTGHSNFAGSPANRRRNIEVGAAAVHGMLVKPGEEFSLVNTLGEIDAKAGYLPELVIKGNKTIPEYGGGLCQIATTVFRSALASGLPITARRNHSYRVSYYEPAGTDAAVYDPWPDIRFANDTGNYILIQSRIKGNDIYFDFWGVKDGRIATTTKPVVYNIVKPAPTKIIETDTLKPGEKKCTERAHNGADAYFDYTVIYPEGSTTTPEKTVRFNSHYVPWQEVCLVGKANASEVTPNPETSSSTSPITQIIN